MRRLFQAQASGFRRGELVPPSCLARVTRAGSLRHWGRLGAALLCLLLSGCIVPAVMYKTVGPPEVPAQYKPAKEPLVVLAENYRHTGSDSFETEQLAREVSQHLKEKEVAPIIAVEELTKLRDREGDKLKTMSISQIGQALGAKQVVYIDIRECRVEQLSGTPLLKGHLTAYVRVVDSQSGQSRWPERAVEGMPLTVETPYFEAGPEMSEIVVRQSMTRTMALRTARLFFGYRPDEGEG